MLTGNTGDNVLIGLGGADTLDGGGGHRYGELCGLGCGRHRQPDDRGWAVAAMPKATRLVQHREPDRLGFDDTLEGNGGNNMLAGGAGIDTVSYANDAAAGRDGQPGPDHGAEHDRRGHRHAVAASRTSPARTSTTR